MSGAGAPATTTAGLDRPNRFEIDLGAVRRNLDAIRRRVGPVWLCAALKADAYGFGLLEVARTVLQASADALSVGDVGAGVRLRQAGVRAPILLYPGSALDAATVAAIQEQGMIATVHNRQSLEALSAHARGPLEVFLKVDVGLLRLGATGAEARSLASQVRASRWLSLTGVYTHLHVVEGTTAEAHLRTQFETFATCAAELGPGLRRMAASSRVLARQPSMLLDAVDPGRALYGLPWEGDEGFQAELSPAFRSLATRLLEVKRLVASAASRPAPFPAAGVERIGVIPMGLRDGLERLHAGHVLVGGRRARLLGQASLEHCRIDLSRLPQAAPGDEVVVVGEQGGERITLADVLAVRPELSATAAALQVGHAVARIHRL